MDIYKFDYRAVPLGMLCSSSSHALDELLEFRKHGILDDLTAMEYAESFYGAVLVACQAYAIGTVSDFNEQRKLLGKSQVKKMALYKMNFYTNIKHSHTELINSLANYFKHKDEWQSWPDNETTKVLRYFEIDEKTAYPLHTGVHKIVGESTNLSALCDELGHWRFYIASKLDEIT